MFLSFYILSFHLSIYNKNIFNGSVLWSRLWDLRIDNSGRSLIHTFNNNFETVLVIIMCDIPNKRTNFSLSFDRSVIEIKFDLGFFKFQTDFFHFYFLNSDISFDI